MTRGTIKLNSSLRNEQLRTSLDKKNFMRNLMITDVKREGRGGEFSRNNSSDEYSLNNKYANASG